MEKKKEINLLNYDTLKSNLKGKIKPNVVNDTKGDTFKTIEGGFKV